jgi:GntR family transcriptional repressor for pyruvate dehydrogenase complex
MRPMRQPQSAKTASLARELIAGLTRQIVGGGLAAGTRLPTEQQLSDEWGVSRTVVREAVAALRAEGLLITRQGSGAFVAEQSQQRPFRIDADALNSLERMIDVMELRLGLEAEAASLAASRRSPADIRRMEKALLAIDDAVVKSERSMAADFDFHLAISDATRNPVFHDFLMYLGHFLIPRQSVRQNTTSADEQAANAALVQQEHRAILLAIRARDTEAARAAMRAHLTGSRERYRKLRDSLERGT